MLFINSDSDLLQYIPNSIKPVTGELSLFDKLAVHLQTAEDWFADNISGREVMQQVAEADPPDFVCSTLKRVFARFIVYEALDRAIPSLDLVLTPNGFGIVSNNTVSPASKQRVDRLIGEVRTTRDDALELALDLLPKFEEWLTSPQADFFRATMFPNVDIVRLCGKEGNVWNNYLQLRAQCFGIELSLEEEYFSTELMDALRREQLDGSLWRHRLRLVDFIRQQIVDVLLDKSINGTRMRDLVNVIRNNPDTFPEWHTSETAKLFSPPRYVNKKSDKGFWF